MNKLEAAGQDWYPVAVVGELQPYVYRMPAPMVALLYKTCPPKPEAQDVIGFQQIEQTHQYELAAFTL